MKKIFLFLLIAGSSIAYGQQPMPMDQIEAKLDSIVVNADVLYSYIKSAESSMQLAKDSSVWLEGESSILCYRNKNLLINLLLDKEDKAVMELIYIDDFSKPVMVKKENRKLEDRESNVLTAKRKSIALALNDERIPDPFEGFYYEYVFIPQASENKLYILNSTEQKNILPLGQNYLLLFPKESPENYRFKDLSHSVGYLELDGKTAITILNQPMDMPMIQAIDICKFNLYRHNEGQVLWAYSQRNRRTFIYNPKSNQISIQ